VATPGAGSTPRGKKKIHVLKPRWKSWFGCEVSSQAHGLNTWSPAGGVILGGSGSFYNYDLAGDVDSRGHVFRDCISSLDDSFFVFTSCLL
jgi:hypothetical protein